MNLEHVEAILVWRRRRSSDAAVRWLTERGLATIRMRRGLLISGDSSQFEAAFGVELVRGPAAQSIPVPTVLKDDVASITIPKPPSYHDVGR